MIKILRRLSKNKKGGEMTQTILIISVALVLALILATWIYTAVHQKMEEADRAYKGETVEPTELTPPIEPGWLPSDETTTSK